MLGDPQMHLVPRGIFSRKRRLVFLLVVPELKGNHQYGFTVTRRSIYPAYTSR